MVRWNSGLLCVKLAPLKKSMKYPRRKKHVARSAHIIAFEIIDYRLQYFDRGWLSIPPACRLMHLWRLRMALSSRCMPSWVSKAPCLLPAQHREIPSPRRWGNHLHGATTILMFAYFNFDFVQPFLVCAGPEQNALQKIFGLDPPKVNEVEKFEEGLGRQFHSGIHQTAASILISTSWFKHFTKRSLVSDLEIIILVTTQVCDDVGHSHQLFGQRVWHLERRACQGWNIQVRWNVLYSESF